MVNNNILIIYTRNIFVFKSQQRQLVVSTLNPSRVQAQEKTMKTLKVDHRIIVIFFILVGAYWPHLVLLCLNLNQENLNLTRLVRHPLSSSNSSTSERGASCPAAPRNTVNVFNYQKAHSANVPRLTVPLHTLTYLSGYEGWMQFFGQNVNVSPLSGQLWSAWCLRWRRWLWPSVRLLTPPSWSRWGR